MADLERTAGEWLLLCCRLANERCSDLTYTSLCLYTSPWNELLVKAVVRIINPEPMGQWNMRLKLFAPRSESLSDPTEVWCGYCISYRNYRI